MSKVAPSVLLLYPPITDPTSPYHSLVYLASSARAQGFTDITIRDLNIEALSYCTRPDVLKMLGERWRVRRRTLQDKGSLNRAEQIEYLYLLRAEHLDFLAPTAAVTTMRSPQRFFDYRLYRRAARDLLFWLDCLSCEGYPGQFSRGFNLFGHLPFSLSKVADLCNSVHLEKVAGPFMTYFEQEFFPSVIQHPYSLVGISITYVSQLPFALWLLRRLRNLLPDCHLVCGGTEVSDIWKYLQDKQLFGEIFAGANSCVVGEGETAFFRLLEGLAEGKDLSGICNLVLINKNGSGITPPDRFQYENVERLPPPEYCLVDSLPYFSPFPFVYYAPTRGCYWDKCTFCDYGLNGDRPTSPWRERSIETVLRDIEAISKYSPYIYLSVDVLAPKWILNFSQGVIEAKINIRWGAEIRLEKYFSAQRCEVLRRSGCVAVSVGFESGCQRILDSIQKGTKAEEIELTIQNFSSVGIPVQMMGFTGFPSEKLNEALDSIAFLERNGSNWTVASLGNFILTPGAIVARRPKDFSLVEVRPFPGADIARSLFFRELRGPSKTLEEETFIDRAKRGLQRSEFDRPFAGGIDTPHSIFYYERYGVSFPQKVRLNAWRDPEKGPIAINGKLLFGEVYDVAELFDASDFSAMIEGVRQGGEVEVDSQAIVSWMEEKDGVVTPVARGNCLSFLRSDGLLLPCSDEMLRLLLQVDGQRTLAEVVERVGQEEPGQRMIYEIIASALVKWEILIVLDRYKTNDRVLSPTPYPSP